MFARAKQNKTYICGSCNFKGSSLSGLGRHRSYFQHNVITDRSSGVQRKRKRLAEGNEDIDSGPLHTCDDDDIDSDDEGESDEEKESEEEEEEDEEDNDEADEEGLNYDDLERIGDMYSTQFLNQQLNFHPDELTPSEKACMQFAAFSTRVGLGKIQVEALLAVLKSGLDVASLPRTQRTLDKRVEEAIKKTKLFTSGTEDGVQEKVIDIADLNPMLPEVRFQYRDPVVAALELLTSVYQVKGDIPPVALNWKFLELKHPTSNERVFKGDHTGDWWCQMEKEYLMPGCLPLVLKFFSDATQTGASRSRCPVVLTVSNLPASLQASDHGKTCIGYIPILKGLGTTANKLGEARKKIFHEVHIRELCWFAY